MIFQLYRKLLVTWTVPNKGDDYREQVCSQGEVITKEREGEVRGRKGQKKGGYNTGKE